ncbi:unnamed protein product [Lymnaea stagnalis]|uniref:Ig-like domain-containing protein n=1 Tax=Lymnaea stagnalis TaxID=6523 RepID=A0AAV2IJQ2_LYMST
MAHCLVTGGSKGVEGEWGDLDPRGSPDLTLAKKKDQGNYECEVLGEGSEGAVQWKKCTKNPGHLNFIPAPKFSLDHLPGEYRDEELLEFVRVVSDRTVKLTVGYTSTNRPDGFIFSNFRGTSIPHTGTGFLYCYNYGDEPQLNVSDVSQDESDEDDDPVKNSETDSKDEIEEDEDDFQIIEQFDLRLDRCPCPECTNSDDPKRSWGYVYAHTAKHVVYDDSEAKRTVVTLNYNDPDCSEGVKTLYGDAVTWEDGDRDWCNMTCVTHDRDVYQSLYSKERDREEQHTDINEKFWRCKTPLAIIVSHPHGCAKQITVGQWTNRTVKFDNQESGDQMTEYTYDTPTCSGTSGAPVVLLGEKGVGRETWWYPHYHTHSGTFDGKLNISGTSDESKVELDDQ